GLEEISIGDTIADPEHPIPLERIHVDEPTMSMVFKVNDGPFAGREGKYVTSRNLRERLQREAYRNVSIRIFDTESPDAFKVIGRGELQLAVIVETMRREGYELTVSNPEPITKEVAGQLQEPMELMVCDVPQAAVGAVTERLGPRRGRMTEMQNIGSDRVRLTFRVPARGLVGFRNEFLTITRGEGIMSSQFDGYDVWQGKVPKRANGAIVSDREGETVAYALFDIQERGQLFYGPGVAVYEGMICGEHAHPNDLDVNVTRGRKLADGWSELDLSDYFPATFAAGEAGLGATPSCTAAIRGKMAGALPSGWFCCTTNRYCAWPPYCSGKARKPPGSNDSILSSVR